MSKKKEPHNMEALTGRWQVVDVRSAGEEDTSSASAGPEEAAKECCGDGTLKGVELTVDENGEATWLLPAAAPKDIQLFDTASCYVNKDGFVFFMGGKKGQTMTFQLEVEETAARDNDRVQLLSEDGDLSITMVKVKARPEVVDDSFSLCMALDEGFFSDISFKCSDRVFLQAHRVVLEAAYPSLAVREWQVLLEAQSSSLGRLLLACVYSDCLPVDVTVPQAQSLMSCLSRQSKLTRLQQFCTAFIEANNLKKKLIQLIDDLLLLLEESKKIVSFTDMSDSVKVKYAIKQLIKDTAVGASKLCLLCELYTRNKKEMSKADKREVIDYLRARVVVFSNLLRELLERTIQKWEGLAQEEQMDVAQDLIPDIEQVWDFFLKSAAELQSSLRGRSLSEKVEQRRAGVSMALNLISRGAELKRLRKIHKEFHDLVELAQRKRERWNGYSSDEKAEQVLEMVGKLVNEGRDVVKSMEGKKNQLLMKSGLEWNRFCSYLDLYTNYLVWVLHRVQSLREPLKPLLLKGLKFVQRSDVNEVVLYMDILSRVELREAMEDEEGGEAATVKVHKQLSPLTSQAMDSVLARGCLQLVGSSHYSDMQFVLGTGPEGGGASGKKDGEKEIVIAAHRVIVASRCKWMRIVLQSKMKEDKEKCIVIPDVEEGVFRLFLDYLYGSKLDTSQLPMDTLIKLMAVADRFEAPLLLGMCEDLLAQRVQDSTVFPLLGAADYYNRHKLREATMQYVLSDPEVIVREMEGFSSLLQAMQQELRQLLSGTQDPTLALRHHTHRHGSQPNSEVGPTCSDSGSSSEGGDEHYQLDPDTLHFQDALQELSAVVGSEVSDSILRDLLLAADMDVNRAINYYFNTQDT